MIDETKVTTFDTRNILFRSRDQIINTDNFVAFIK